MLTVIYGVSSSGKTSFILDKIKNDGESGVKSVLIVPEQYSHDAERHLCMACGNGVSMYAEVISFSRLCNRILSVRKTLGKPLDPGGRLLIMSRALGLALPELKIFKTIRNKPAFADELLNIYGEMRSACVRPEELAAAAGKLSGSFSDKLQDLGIVLAAYEAHIPDGMYDPSDALDALRREVAESDIGLNEKIYIDGFTDFTMQERTIIQELVRKSADVTVCLTCGDLEDPSSPFVLPVETAQQLIRFAAASREQVHIIEKKAATGKKREELVFLGENLFSYGTVKFDGVCESIELYKADSAEEECELACARILELVREKGYRWRDFAVAARGWEEWETMAENVFADYGIPLQMASKSDILEKPVIAVMFSAVDIILSDWDYKSVFKYLKTGMTGIPAEDIDVLENYVIKWNIRGRSMWTREEWTFNPDGYAQSMTDGQRDVLDRVNKIRRCVVNELCAFDDDFKAQDTGKGKIKALYKFLEAIDLPSRIEERAAALRAAGDMQLCDEYLQLWEILIGALEQYADIMAEEKTDGEKFAALLRLMISKYTVGTIPVSIDRVSAGDMTRMRRRDIKVLILMGMTEDAVPQITKGSYILSDDERETLADMGFAVGDTAQNRISREMNMVYTSLTLPSERIIMSWNTAEGHGKASFAVTTAEKMFDLQPVRCDDSVKISAPLPCFEFALGGAEDSVMKKTAEEYFKLSADWRQKFENAKKAAAVPRGRLSPGAAERLYNKKLSVTASRVDKYYACRFSYFMQYGLRAKQRTTAGFDAPEAGTFMHYLLENVAGEAERLGGFGQIDREQCRRLTRKYAAEYVNSTLNGFKDKNNRFKYLFNRLASDAETVVLDMADELANSDFKPVDFELTFAPDGELPPAVVSDGETEISVTGIVDRADAWIHNDKLYLRVVDYKTGKKSFSLSDIWYGMGMQMLIYLFALQQTGYSRYGREIVPAGVMYAPARDIIMEMPRGSTAEEIESERMGKLRRSGLFLNDPELIEAMEHGKAPKYLPVKFKKDGSISSDSIAELEKLGKLSKHIDKMLLQMGKELRQGRIEAQPYYRGEMDNACCWCDYFEACHFEDGSGSDKIRYLRRLKTAEAWEKIAGEGEN